MKIKWLAIIGMASAAVLNTHATLVMDWKGMSHSSDLGYNTATVALSGITSSSATKGTDTFGSTAVSVADFGGSGSLSVVFHAGDAFNSSTWASTVTNFSANAARGLGVGTGGALTAQRGLNNSEVIVFTIDTSSLNTGGNKIQFRVIGWNNAVNLYKKTGATAGALLQSAIAAGTNSYWFDVDGLKTYALQSASGTANFATLEIKVDTGTVVRPTGLSASAGNDVVQLDWDASLSPEFESYKIYRSSVTANLTGADLYATMTTNTFTDADVNNNVTYYYAVSTVGTNTGETALSDVVSATPAIPVPTGLSASANNSLVRLDWNASAATEIVSYNIYRSSVTANLTGSDLYANATTNTFADTNVTNNITYCYAVTTVGTNSGETALSDVVSATPAIPVPTRLSAVVSNSVVRLDWDDSTDVMFGSFIVYRSTTPGSGYTAIASNLTTSAYTDTNADTGTTYYYKVSQVDTNGFESGLSGWVSSSGKPNILLIVIDDQNTWPMHDPIRYTGKVIVPNIDRLANSGVKFTRACTAASICVASRSAFVSGVAPWRSGIYQNQTSIESSPILQVVPSFFQIFHEAGYHTAKRGKVTHGWSVPNEYWNENSSGATRDTPYPGIQDPNDPNKVLPLKGWGNYGPEADWGVIDDPNNIGPIQEADMTDTGHANWAVNKINNYNEDKPFFIAVGFFHPHYPWHAPQKYFDMYPLESLVQPPINPTDQDDIPALGRALLGDQDADIKAHNDELKATRAYLACTTYVDTQIGRVLDALDASPYASNTIVILISDHGYHVGEKQHWFKATTWEEAVNCLFMVRAPGITKPNQVCRRMVSLLDLYPTLLDLAGLEHPSHLDGRSLLPLLKDPDMEWDHPATATYNMEMSICSEQNRYIRYTDGTDELYDRTMDPHEWTNLVDNVAYRGIKNYLNGLLPAPEEIAGDCAPADKMSTLTLQLTVGSTGPGGGYLQLSPTSNEGISIIPMPETPGTLTVHTTYRSGRRVLITPVNFKANWSPGGSASQGTVFYQANGQTIQGQLTYGSDLGSAYDAWASTYGGDAAIGTGGYDFDGDGVCNFMEYCSGGDPTDPGDTGSKLTLYPEQEDIRLVVPQRTGDSNVVYYIESCNDLTRHYWDFNQYLDAEVGSSTGALNNVHYFYPMNSTSTFFRVSVEAE